LGDLAKANAVLSIPEVQVNEQDNAGWTPLMIAGMGCLGCVLISVSAGKEDIAERLLEGTEVDVLLQNRNGATALYYLSLVYVI
jgi:ankyrin repeat protein